MVLPIAVHFPFPSTDFLPQFSFFFFQVFLFRLSLCLSLFLPAILARAPVSELKNLSIEHASWEGKEKAKQRKRKEKKRKKNPKKKRKKKLPKIQGKRQTFGHQNAESEKVRFQRLQFGSFWFSFGEESERGSSGIRRRLAWIR